MAEETKPKSEVIANFEALGEAEVRSKLVAGHFGSKGFERLMAEDWLNQKFFSRSAAAERRKQITDTMALIAAIIAAVAATIGAIASIILLFR